MAYSRDKTLSVPSVACGCLDAPSAEHGAHDSSTQTTVRL